MCDLDLTIYEYADHWTVEAVELLIGWIAESPQPDERNVFISHGRDVSIVQGHTTREAS